MQNSMVAFPVFNRKYPLYANLVQKINIVNLCWNLLPTISDKNNWDSLYFHKKVHKKTLDLLKVTQNPPFPLTQCCAKPEEAMPGSGDQKWAGKFATNIE